MPAHKKIDENSLDLAPGEVAGIFDLNDPRALPNLLPKSWKTKIMALDPKWFGFSERNLRHRCKPDRIDNMLRNRFWAEYNRAQAAMENMNTMVIMQGVTYVDYLRKVVLKNPDKLAWVVRPPPELETAQEESLQEGIYQLREMLTRYDDPDFVFNTTEKVGKDGQTVKKRSLNVAAISELRKIVEVLSVRVQGAITQKLMVAQQVKVSSPFSIGPDESPPKDGLTDIGQLEQMQKKLHKLNKTIEKTGKISETIVEGEILEQEANAVHIDDLPEGATLNVHKGEEEFILPEEQK